MKFTVTFKTPDALSSALEDVDKEERSHAEEAAMEFIKYGEYVKIEIDSETMTARVLRIGE